MLGQSTLSWSAISIPRVPELHFPKVSHPPSYASNAASQWKQGTQLREETQIQPISTSRIQFCGGEWIHLFQTHLPRLHVPEAPHTNGINAFSSKRAENKVAEKSAFTIYLLPVWKTLMHDLTYSIQETRSRNRAFGPGIYCINPSSMIDPK